MIFAIFICATWKVSGKWTTEMGERGGIQEDKQIKLERERERGAEKQIKVEREGADR